MKKKLLLLLAYLLINNLSYSQTIFTAHIQTQNTVQTPIACKDSPLVLIASPNNESFKYQWFKNNELILESQGSNISITEDGIYKVLIKSKSREYESEQIIVQSCEKPKFTEKTNSQNGVQVATPTISCTNPVICGSNASATLLATPQDASYTYQWYYSTTSNGTFSAISGATSSSHTTSNIGWYKVFVNDGITIPALSSPFQITNYPIGILSDLNDNLYPIINTTANTNVPVKVKFHGVAPFTFSYRDGANTKTITTNDNPYYFSVSADQNKQFYLSSLTHSCSTNGNSITSGSISLVIDNTTSLSLSTPNTTNICAGSTIDIPYNTTGTWGLQKNMDVVLYNTVTGNSVAYLPNIFSNPIKLTIPSNLALNSTYKIYVYSRIPYINNSIHSPYTLTVTSTGCSPNATVSLYPSNVSCGSVSLQAYPYESNAGYKYLWYKNDVSIGQPSTSNYYTATESGNYKVTVTNTSTGYSSTSQMDFPVSITLGAPIIQCSNPVICGNNTSATLTSSITGAGYTYQWLFSTNQNSYTPIVGATNSSYTASTIGYYLVRISNGSCESTSQNSFNVRNSPMAYITNEAETNSSVSINSGQSTTLKVLMTGEPPYMFTYSDGSNSRTIFTSTSPYLLTVSPEQSRYYYLSSFSGKCGTGYSGNGIAVNVAPLPTMTLQTPPTTTTCPGGRFEIPYTTSRTWTSERKIDLELIDANTNNYISNSYFRSNASSSPIYYEVPNSISAGTYKINIYTELPNGIYINTPYTITINASGCTIPSARIEGEKNNCSSYFLNAYPNTSGNTFQWYKDGIEISNSNQSYFYAYSNGNYTVKITNSSGYNSTSPAFNVVNVSFLSNNSFSGQSYCVGGSTLIAPNTSAGNTYQWYYAPTTFGYSPISGATNSSYTSLQGGSYLLITKNGTCESTSRFNCPYIIDFVSKSVCQQASVTVPITNSFYGRTVTLQLLDAVTNQFITNLATTTSSSFIFNLPTSVGAGTYKFKTIDTYGVSSIISDGTLTVTSSIAPATPILAANPSIINSTQTVTLTASGCNGTLVWTDNTSAGSSRTVTLSQSAIYKAYCQDNSGCQSPISSVIIKHDCGDTFEPNNDATTSKQITGDNYTSSALCFDNGLDEDWFDFVINGKKYYARVKLWSNSYDTDLYRFKKTLVNNVLTIETIANTVGSSIDTEIFLYADDGISELGYNDDGNGSGLSKIVFNLGTSCQTNLVLTSPLYDIYENETSTIKANIITATNKVKNTSNAYYRAEQNIVLNPGFETQISTGGYFKAEIKGCNQN